MARRYKCPYCEYRDERAKLIVHVDRMHKEMIPEGYDGARLIFDMINKTTGGKCRVCGNPTPWNGSRYDTLCNNPKCKEKMREEYKKNMLRVRGTYNILNDPEQQKLMLSHRKISGKYQHSDGGVITYTGEYERNALEFMDLMLQIPSKEIYSPGPTMEYTYQGKKHIYIPDFYLPLYNLIIEIKDGGDNPNGQQSASRIASREKTIEKERVITTNGEYNYIRLTNNEFPQLIEIFMTMKKKIMDGEPSQTIRINEHLINDMRDWADSRKKIPDFDKIKMLNKAMSNLNKEVPMFSDSIVPYKTLTPKGFKDYGGGYSWDYTAFEAEYIKEKIPTMEYETYFAIIEDNASKITDYHSFLIFKYKEKWFWLESYLDKFIGIRGFDTKKECIGYIAYRLSQYANKPTVFINQYNALDTSYYNIDAKKFVALMVKNMSRSNIIRIKDNITYFYKFLPK